MTIPTLETIANYLSIFIAVIGALTAAFWLSLVIWAFRDMRLRSRDPFAQILAAIMVAAIPFVGIVLYLILRPPETLAERYERALEEEALLQEIEERARCPKCTRVTEEDWVMCATCHHELKKQCPTCYALLELGWSRCPFCSASQPSKRPALSPERLLRSRILAGAPPVQSQPAVVAPQPSPAQPLIVSNENGHGTNGNGHQIRRRYRSVRLNGTNGNGNGNGQHAQPTNGKYIEGNTHPTVVQMPVVDSAETRPMTPIQTNLLEEDTVLNNPIEPDPTDNETS